MTEQADVIKVDLWYPRNEGNPTNVEITLMDVRAADNLNVSYDFERDGWVIRQDVVRETDAGDLEVVDEAQEVAFLPAWNMAQKSPEEMTPL